MSEHATAVATSIECRNCGAPLAGKFCHDCGEGRPDDHEYQISHVLHDAVHEFLHLDGKIFRTLWLLIARPGFLTREFWFGRRTNYIRPLRLFIVIATIHFLLIFFNFYKTDLFKRFDFGGNLSADLAAIAKQTHRTVAEVEQSVEHHFAKGYAVAQYTAVTGFALVPWLIYRRRKPFYGQHFIFSLHIYSAYFLLQSVLNLLITREVWLRAAPILMPVTLIYIAIALRLLYGESWLRTAGKAIAIRIGLFAAEFVALGIALTYALFQSARGH
jgi:hypothetical protein